MKSLLGKKIFIIGGNGYIGNFIAAKMIQHQATVYCLTRYKKCLFLEEATINMNTQKMKK